MSDPNLRAMVRFRIQIIVKKTQGVLDIKYLKMIDVTIHHLNER